jgi:hypothetical protein
MTGKRAVVAGGSKSAGRTASVAQAIWRGDEPVAGRKRKLCRLDGQKLAFLRVARDPTGAAPHQRDGDPSFDLANTSSGWIVAKRIAEVCRRTLAPKFLLARNPGWACKSRRLDNRGHRPLFAALRFGFFAAQFCGA